MCLAGMWRVARVIGCSMTSFAMDRAHLYDGMLFSKQSEKRQPPTVVSLSLHFYKSMCEIVAEQSVDMCMAIAGKNDTLLDQAHL